MLSTPVSFALLWDSPGSWTNFNIDLKMENIMIKVESISIVYDYVKGETEDPCPRKLSDDRIIYLSRNDFGPFRGNPGTPTISDFGLAVWGDKGVLNHPIQPDCFRAPEVMLGAEWTYSVDIWNFGALVCSTPLTLRDDPGF